MRRNDSEQRETPREINANGSFCATFVNGENNTVCRPLTVNIVFVSDAPPGDVSAIVRAVLDGLTGASRRET